MTRPHHAIRARLVAVSIFSTLATAGAVVLFTLSHFSFRSIETARDLLVPTVRLMATQLDERIREIERVTFLALAASPSIQSLVDPSARGEFGETDLIRISQSLQPAAHPWVTGIYVFLPSGAAVYHQGSPSLRRGFDITSESWWAEYEQGNSAPFIVPASTPDRFVLPMRTPVLSIVSSIRSVLGDRSSAHVVVDLRANRVFGTWAHLEGWALQSPFVIHPTGAIQYVRTPEARRVAEVLTADESWSGISRDAPEVSYQDVSVDGEDYLVAYGIAPYTRWVVGTAVPRRSVLELARGVQGAGALIGIIALVAGLVLARFATNMVFRPVEEFRDHIGGIDDPTNIPPFVWERNDELGVLVGAFNRMADRVRSSVEEIKDLNERTSATVERLRRAELLALQIQINPHFLHNTLESIAATAEVNGDEEARDMVVSLGRILRAGIADPRTTISVREELENLRHYLLIEKIRLDQRLEYHISCPAALEEARTLRLVVQPVVENIIRHGMDHRRTATTISVHVSRADAMLLFRVTDSGPRPSRKDIERLRAAVKNTGENILARDRSIGLANVNERITLMFGGADYGVFVDGDEEDPGLVVTIRQPLEYRRPGHVTSDSQILS